LVGSSKPSPGADEGWLCPCCSTYERWQEEQTSDDGEPLSLFMTHAFTDVGSDGRDQDRYDMLHVTHIASFAGPHGQTKYEVTAQLYNKANTSAHNRRACPDGAQVFYQSAAAANDVAMHETYDLAALDGPFWIGNANPERDFIFPGQMPKKRSAFRLERSDVHDILQARTNRMEVIEKHALATKKASKRARVLKTRKTVGCFVVDS